MINATATMTIDTFMNVDIDLGLSYVIIFVIRVRDYTMPNLSICNSYIHSKGSKISEHRKN